MPRSRRIYPLCLHQHLNGETKGLSRIITSTTSLMKHTDGWICSTWAGAQKERLKDEEGSSQRVSGFLREWAKREQREQGTKKKKKKLKENANFFFLLGYEKEKMCRTASRLFPFFFVWAQKRKVVKAAEDLWRGKSWDK